MPFIHVFKYKYKFFKDINYYDLAPDSFKPEIYEVIDPMAEPLKKEELIQTPFLDKFKKVFASISFISPLNAANCPTMVKPSTGPVTSSFGYRVLDKGQEFHGGVDYGIPMGTSLPSIANGTVITASGGCAAQGSLGNNCGGGFGNYVMVKLENGDVVVYAHLSSVDVKVGQTVTSGTVIGKSGSSGRSTGPHLHFEIRVGGDRNNRVDPVKYLASCGATKWNGSGAPPSGGSGTVSNGGASGTGGSNNNRFQVENLPWYSGGDDTLSDTRYNELFKLDDTCEK
ncbi:MAG: Murein DD-endopeptidase MepM [Alphaproteobacteria bacterium ADurb.Bin438]|nr:MAG: Murein DD-endopeptidase MepM [Alphaproteobacteria bacterium ADurb.Bin438]